MRSFLMNSWYCAGWGKDLTDKPIGIKIVGVDIVLFRKSDGSLAALRDRCPHRFAPLSLGCVKGDAIECAYHGLQYDGAGKCILNPHGRGKVPARAHVRAFPVEERHGALWVWMGEPELANADDIIDLYFMRDPHLWTVFTGYLKISADYQLVIDNLLDLTHATYIHASTLGIDPEASLGTSLEFECRTEGNIVHSNYGYMNSPLTVQLKPFSKHARADIFANMQWHPAGSLLLDFGASDVGIPRGADSLLMPSAHLVVPETASTSHYFYAVARNVERDDTEKTKFLKELVVKAFIDEDEPIVRACFNNMYDEEFFGLKPAILETDVAAINARRILQKLIGEEQDKNASGQESASTNLNVTTGRE